MWLGQKEGETFVVYIDHLSSSGYTPPKSSGWLKKIKDGGNEKNHELKLASIDEAVTYQAFLEMLLTFMYEYGDQEEIKDTSQ